MALDNITRFEWDSDRRRYILEMRSERYAVRTNGKIRYLPWLKDKWIITDRSDLPFNGDPCRISVEVMRGNEERAGEIEKELKMQVLVEDII